MGRCFDRTHRSYSSDRTWDECQYKWKATTADGGKFPTIINERMAIGSAVDAYVSGALAGSPISMQTAWTEAIATRDGQAAIIFNETGCLEELARFVPKCDEVIAALAPNIREVQPEWHFLVDGEEYHAHPDFLMDDYSIFDLKTSQRRLETDRVHFDTQLSAYAYASVAVGNPLPPTVALIGLISNKSGVTIDTQIGTRSERQLGAFASDVSARLIAQKGALREDNFTRNGRSHPYACGSCAVKSSCPSWAGTELEQLTEEI